MSDLLPPNSTALERRLAEVCAASAAGHFDLRRLWDPESCPLDLLPWLAWAYSVDEWDTSWSERQQRDTVASALQVQSIKGTAGAVQQALDALGINCQIQEWWQQTPTAEPYTFKLHIETNYNQLTQREIARAIATVMSVKNLRSHLSAVTVTASVASDLYVGCALIVGNEITISGFRQEPVIINEHAICIP